jgi:hypothetical protein
MIITAYRLSSRPVNIRPASCKREWMDSWPRRHPYHCLPLTAANGFGWEIGCATSFEAVWDGSEGCEGVRVMSAEKASEELPYGRFGRGILTFPINCIIRTEEPYQLFVTGPLNCAKDGLSPLSGIIYTSWMPFPFAMSYQFTRRDTVVRFSKDDPFCTFFPIVPTTIESMEPVWRDLDSDPILRKNFQEWSLSRALLGGDLEFSTKEGECTPYEFYGKHLHMPAYSHLYQRAMSPGGSVIGNKPVAKYRIGEFANTEEERPYPIKGNDADPGSQPDSDGQGQ